MQVRKGWSIGYQAPSTDVLAFAVDGRGARSCSREGFRHHAQIAKQASPPRAAASAVATQMCPSPAGGTAGFCLIAAEQRDLLRSRAPPHCTPRLTPGPASFAPRLTPLPATCTPLLTPHHPCRLGLSI